MQVSMAARAPPHRPPPGGVLARVGHDAPLCSPGISLFLRQVMFLQRWYRSRAVRHKYKGCIASAVVIQKHVRGMLARERLIVMEVAAITIQRCEQQAGIGGVDGGGGEGIAVCPRGGRGCAPTGPGCAPA